MTQAFKPLGSKWPAFTIPERRMCACSRVDAFNGTVVPFMMAVAFKKNVEKRLVTSRKRLSEAPHKFIAIKRQFPREVPCVSRELVPSARIVTGHSDNTSID